MIARITVRTARITCTLYICRGRSSEAGGGKLGKSCPKNRSRSFNFNTLYLIKWTHPPPINCYDRQVICSALMEQKPLTPNVYYLLKVKNWRRLQNNIKCNDNIYHVGSMTITSQSFGNSRSDSENWYFIFFHRWW